MSESLNYLRSLPCVSLNKAATVRFEASSKTGVYAICVDGTNTSDSKIYVGSAMQSFAKRMNLHRWSLRCGNHHSKGLQAVFNTYGFDCLYFCLVEQVDQSDGESKEDFRDRLIAREQFWIDAVPTEIRLNGSPTAGSCAGVKMRPEIREGHGLRVRLALAKPETKAKHSESTKRMWQDPEYRELISIARIRTWQNPGYREKFSEAVKESYRNNPERIEALQISGRKNWENPELRAKMIEINREINNRPEIKALKSENAKRMWADPKWKEKQKNIFNEIFATEEYRQKLKEGQAKFKKTEGYQKKCEAIGLAAKERECLASPPKIIISPSFEVYVTDSLNQFARDRVGSCNGSGLSDCANGNRPTHKGWRVYAIDSWLDVPSFATHQVYTEHKELSDYIPFTEAKKHDFICKEKEIRRELKQKVYDQWLKNKLIELGSKADPCIFISPIGIKYVTDVPTQLAEAQGYKVNHQKSRFTQLANGKCLSYLGWRGYKLTSWADVPNDAIRALWGDHPDLPLPTKPKARKGSNFIQLNFNF